MRVFSTLAHATARPFGVLQGLYRRSAVRRQFASRLQCRVPLRRRACGGSNRGIVRCQSGRGRGWRASAHGRLPVQLVGHRDALHSHTLRMRSRTTAGPTHETGNRVDVSTGAMRVRAISRGRARGTRTADQGLCRYRRADSAASCRPAGVAPRHGAIRRRLATPLRNRYSIGQSPGHPRAVDASASMTPSRQGSQRHREPKPSTNRRSASARRDTPDGASCEGVRISPTNRGIVVPASRTGPVSFRHVRAGLLRTAARAAYGELGGQRFAIA